ncbi:MAG: hypothetical protein JOS17DRAFT_819723 [Linnemannia elongata]|nr:MAG: hypothetical protein JOS17DRAFT_819723 [Linnemannia elongata]
MERRKGESDHDKKDDHDEEAEDDDEVDDPKMLFSIEHIRRWWNVARPPKPVRCSSFQDHDRKEASTLVDSRHGELIRILFYGEPDEIRNLSSSVENIEVWGVDPGEVITAAFCRLLRDCLTLLNINPSMQEGGQGQPHPLTPGNRILPPAIEAKNLVVNRQSIYQPVFAHASR